MPIEDWVLAAADEVREARIRTYLEILPAELRGARKYRLERMAKAGTRPPGLHARQNALILIVPARPKTVDIPLFDFGAPNVPGCLTTLQTSTNVNKNASWKIVFTGASIKEGKSVSVSFKSTFNAQAGEYKRVFTQIPVLESSRYEYTGDDTSLELIDTNAEPDYSRLKREPAPAVKEIATPGIGSVIQNFLLAKDRPGELSEYEYIYEGSSDLSVTASGGLHTANAAGAVGVTVTKSLSIKIVLAGGRARCR